MGQQTTSEQAGGGVGGGQSREAPGQNPGVWMGVGMGGRGDGWRHHVALVSSSQQALPHPPTIAGRNLTTHLTSPPQITKLPPTTLLAYEPPALPHPPTIAGRNLTTHLTSPPQITKLPPTTLLAGYEPPALSLSEVMICAHNITLSRIHVHS